MSKFDAVKSLTGSASTGLGAAALAPLAAGPVGLVATPIMMLLGKIFHGADPRQVPASQIQQAFEAASKNLHYVAKAGMISREEAVAGMRFFLPKGDEYFKQNEKALGKAGTAGKAGMHKTIEAEIAATQRLVATTRTRSVDLAKAHMVYVGANSQGQITAAGGLQDGRPGHWYVESLQAAGRLVDSYLASLPQPQAIVEKATSLLTAPLSESLPVPTWIVAAGVLLLGVLVWGAD